MKVNVIVPVFNEEKTITTVLEAIKAQKIQGVEFETIVVDDGSTDNTVKILEAKPELYGKLIKLSTNMGKGGAIKAGLRTADGDMILFQDADLEYSPNDYGKLLRPVTEFNADLVMGSRIVAPEFTRVVYFWHKVGNYFITFLFNILNNTTFTDIYSCYILYRRSLVNGEELKRTSWDQQAEILSYAVKRAENIYEVPISYRGRTYREGKKIRAYHVFSVVRTIITMKLFGVP